MLLLCVALNIIQQATLFPTNIVIVVIKSYRMNHGNSFIIQGRTQTMCINWKVTDEQLNVKSFIKFGFDGDCGCLSRSGLNSVQRHKQYGSKKKKKKDLIIKSTIDDTTFSSHRSSRLRFFFFPCLTCSVFRIPLEGTTLQGPFSAVGLLSYFPAVCYVQKIFIGERQQTFLLNPSPKLELPNDIIATVTRHIRACLCIQKYSFWGPFYLLLKNKQTNKNTSKTVGSKPNCAAPRYNALQSD